jgi:hypothetical protein
MFYYIAYDGFGKILQKVKISTEELPENTTDIKYLPVENIEFDLKNFRVNLETKELVQLPIFNENTHYFDYTTYSVKPDLFKLINLVKKTRNELLLSSDWTELPSALARLGEAKVTEWQTYRQALRDIPQQSGYPLNVIWPEQPQ